MMSYSCAWRVSASLTEVRTHEEADVEPGDHDDAGEHLQLLLEQDADDGRRRHAGAAEDDRPPDHEAELLGQRALDSFSARR